MMATRRSRIISLLMALAVAALVAQLGGVGGTRQAAHAAKPKRLATMSGASVPDVGSTQLAATSVKAGAGDTVRMTAKASVAAAALPKGATAAVVCGIRYSRAKDAAWTLGTPYETTMLPTRTTHRSVTIERSFAAPAADTYRMSVACHVSAPAKGAKVNATGTIRVARGLPSGAAKPVH
jgi:hypothetical protein